MAARVYSWRPTDEAAGISIARAADDDGWRFEATEILVAGGRPTRTSFTVVVDADGIVLDYEGFATRIR